MEFLRHDLILWQSDLIKSYAKDQTYTVREFASIWVQIQGRHERLLKLISILHNFLEKNISIEKLTEFKREVKKEFMVIVKLLSRLFPLLTPEKGLKFLNPQLAAANGLYHMTNLSEIQQKVLESPEFAIFKVDFRIYYQDAVEYLLQGLLS